MRSEVPSSLAPVPKSQTWIYRFPAIPETTNGDPKAPVVGVGILVRSARVPALPYSPRGQRHLPWGRNGTQANELESSGWPAINPIVSSPDTSTLALPTYNCEEAVRYLRANTTNFKRRSSKSSPSGRSGICIPLPRRRSHCFPRDSSRSFLRLREKAGRRSRRSQR